MGGSGGKNVIDNLIEVIGISDNLPTNSRYFKQFQIQEVCSIPIEKPDIEQILRLFVDVEIFSTKIICTPEGVSNEGQILTGKKLLVRGKLIQKIEYIASNATQSVHAAEFESIFSNYIVLDDYIETTVPLTVTPYIEDIYIKQIDKRNVFKNIMLFINVYNNECIPMKLNHQEREHKKYSLCNLKKYRYFTQFVLDEICEVPNIKPDIEQVISVIVEPEIISIKVINTPRGISAEGQYLSGKKIVAELMIKQKILYVADLKEQSVHGFEKVFYQSVYVVVPPKIEGTDIDVLLKNKKLEPILKVEDVYFKQIDKRKLFKNITLYLEFSYIPTYQLCYCCYDNCTSSNLSIMYEDGKHSTQITYNEENKNIKPLWSPNGQYIAFLSDNEQKGKYMLNIINIKNLNQKQLTASNMFNSVSSYCFTLDSRKIIFSAIKDKCKELFSVDIEDFNINRLTIGDGVIKSYNPKISPDGNKVAFLRSINNVSNIWILDLKGYELNKIINCGYIKDFDWLDNHRIVFVWDKECMKGNLYCIDVNNLETKEFFKCNDLYIKKYLKVSPNDNYIAFIGSSYNKVNTDDIYVYDIKNKSFINLTQNDCNIKISDFVWKIDSSKIYYASNELIYYNVYSIYIDGSCKKQLTNTTASKIELSYRPRIK